jgi:SAM-dependent methyltransferase
MREQLAALLVCPGCGGPLALSAERIEAGEVIAGRLRCESCGSVFAVRRGVPRMCWAMEELEEVARSFSYQWKAHHAGRLESDTVFGRTLAEDWAQFTYGTRVGKGELAGMRVLDAGCGSGRLTRQIAEHGAGMVVGADINEAVDEIRDRNGDVPNLHVVQANLSELPFPPGSFDLVWSCGVIHHTPDAAAAFRALARQVRPGGVLFVWVYPKRFNPFRATKTVFDLLGLGRLQPAAIMRIAKAMSYPSLALLGAYRLVRRLPGLRPRGAWARRTVKPRTLREIQLTWNDALSPKYDSRHSEAEVIGWFEAAGFRDVAAMEEPKVGVRGVAPGPSRQRPGGARAAAQGRPRTRA